MNALLLILFLPLTLAVPERKSLLDVFQPNLLGLDNVTTLKKDVQLMANILGSDPTEQACEAEGHKLFHAGLLDHAVPLVCHSFQALLKHFQISAESAAVGQKRFLFDAIPNLLGLVNVTTLKKDLQLMANILGSDPTEQACEAEGHKLFHAGLLDHAVPLVCHSFQALLKHFQISAESAAVGQKRFLFDAIPNLLGLVNVTTLKKDLQLMANILGSDPTEQACEAEGHKLFHAGLLDHAVPLVCHSFQALLKHFQISAESAAVGQKRFLFDAIPNLLGLVNVTTLKKDLQLMANILGSDPTEQACEAEGHKLFHAGLLDHAVPLVCHSFQALLKQFQISAESAAVGQKRFLFDAIPNLLGLINVTTLKKDLQLMANILGSDPTEQACEAEGHKLFHAGLLDHAVPLVCHSFQQMLIHFGITPDPVEA